MSVDTSRPTSMAGLNCGTVSTIAWPAIRDTLAAAVVVTDDQARAAMQRLHELGVLEVLARPHLCRCPGGAG